MSFVVPPDAIEVVQGECRVIDRVVTDSRGVGVDITGWRIVMTVRKKASDPTFIFRKDTINGDDDADDDVTFDFPKKGRYQIHLKTPDTAKADPGVYEYDIWAFDPTGNAYPQVRLSQLIVTQGATRLPL